MFILYEMNVPKLTNSHNCLYIYKWNIYITIETINNLIIVGIIEIIEISRIFRKVNKSKQNKLVLIATVSVLHRSLSILSQFLNIETIQSSPLEIVLCALTFTVIQVDLIWMNLNLRVRTLFL